MFDTISMTIILRIETFLQLKIECDCESDLRKLLFKFALLGMLVFFSCTACYVKRKAICTRGRAERPILQTRVVLNTCFLLLYGLLCEAQSHMYKRKGRAAMYSLQQEEAGARSSHLLLVTTSRGHLALVGDDLRACGLPAE
ncbi:hypothetical protein ACLB2K_028551 [Fragaria x ananassa]